MKDALVKYGPALSTGILTALCFPTFHLYALAWVALVPLLWSAHDTGPRETALRFFFAGLMFHELLFQWLVVNVMWAGGWAIIGQQLVCIVLALYWALAGAIWSWLRGRVSRVAAMIGLVIVWAAMEQLEASLFTSFGWASLAYSQGPDLPLLQWAAIGSTTPITMFIVSVNALFAQALCRGSGRIHSLSAAALLVAGAHGLGYLLLDEPQSGEDPFRVGIFQSNFSQEMKWDREYTSEMVRNASQKSLALAQQRDVDLVVWPEALIVGDIDDPAIFQPISSATRNGDFHIFTGAARRDGEHSYNSSYLVSNEGAITGIYDKIHLAPFGEYVPMADVLPFVGWLVPSIGDLTPGTEPKVMKVGSRAFGPLICFEMLFPAMSHRLMVEGADFLVVVTNLAWFGRSNAIPQELEVARLRAVETRLPLVHSANTGISGVFDPWGRFEMLNGIVDSSGRVQRLREDLGQEDTRMHRLVGDFDLPEPAPRPVPYPPHYIGWLTVVLSALLIAGAKVYGRDQPRPGRGTS